MQAVCTSVLVAGDAFAEAQASLRFVASSASPSPLRAGGAQTQPPQSVAAVLLGWQPVHEGMLTFAIEKDRWRSSLTTGSIRAWCWQ